jgi:SNF family Na+-dependent transporter
MAYWCVFRDALIVSSMDMLTSILAGFVIFTTFGYMAHQTGNTVAGVAKAGME